MIASFRLGAPLRLTSVKPSAAVGTVAGPHLILQARPQESWRVIAPFLERASRRVSG